MKADERKCPRCAETIKLDAKVCRHCGHTLTADEIAAGKAVARKQLMQGGIGCLILLVLLMLALSMCSPEDLENETTSANDAAVSEATVRPEPKADSDQAIKAAARDAAAMFPPEKLPASVAAPPTEGVCMSTLCALNKVQFENRDWPRAWKGDYQARRNVAHCFGTGCNGAVEIREIDACAWRVVIVDAHPDRSNDIDASNLRQACQRLDQSEAVLADRKAQAILERPNTN